jgi:hypothetical protein
MAQVLQTTSWDCEFQACVGPQNVWPAWVNTGADNTATVLEAKHLNDVFLLTVICTI